MLECDISFLRLLFIIFILGVKNRFMRAWLELLHILVELVNKMMDIDISMQDEGAVGHCHYLFIVFHHLCKTYIK